MKQYQESELEFRREEPDDCDYPIIRWIVIYSYGGTLEECVANARKQFNLDNEWELVSSKIGED